FQRGSCARVNVILRRIVGENAALLDGDQVVRIGDVILLLHGGRNLVVRLGENAIKRGARRIVAEGAKGMNLGHGISGVSLSSMRSLPFYANSARFRKRPKGRLKRNAVCAGLHPQATPRRLRSALSVLE